jgi:hypothetical protein
MLLDRIVIAVRRLRHPELRWQISISATRFESWRVLRSGFVPEVVRG